jgi:lysozyme
MTRKTIFDTIQAERGGKSWQQEEVALVDGLLTRLGIAKDPVATPTPKPATPASVSKPVKAGALVGAVGIAAAAILSPFVSGWESGGKQHLTAYQDIVGVWTLCDGETLGVKKGDTDTAEGCAIRLDTRLAGFAQEVAKCTPSLKGKDELWASATSLAYNIGTGAYCKSTVDRQFDAGNSRAACDAFLMWDKAGGKRVQGLANRRAAERTLCLKGIKP